MSPPSQAYELMARDNFPRFKKTDSWHVLLKEMGAYDSAFLAEVCDVMNVCTGLL